jgi:hypothetical protein
MWPRLGATMFSLALVAAPGCNGEQRSKPQLATGGAVGSAGAGGDGFGGDRVGGGRGGTSSDGATGGVASAGGVTGAGGVPLDGGALGAGGAIRAGGASGSTGARTGGASGGSATGAADASTTDGSTAPTPYKGVANSPASQLAALGATWCYNWGTTPKSTECADPYFVPMVWGKSDVAGAIKAIGDKGYTTVLGFNEPNKSDQANMTVDEAIALWPALTSNPAIRVSSPAVSDDGRSWLESFMTQVKAKGLRVDFIAMHWYGWNAGSCTAAQLEGAVTWASKWGLPVWLTEFGCMNASDPDAQTVLSFFGNAIPMLAKHPLVERYAWFPWNTNNELYLANGNNVPVITALGTAFAAAPPYRP